MQKMIAITGALFLCLFAGGQRVFADVVTPGLDSNGRPTPGLIIGIIVILVVIVILVILRKAKK